MIKFIRIMILSMVALLLSNSVNAIPIDVVESSDFANSNGSGADLGAFDIGINRVTGSVLRDSMASVGAGDYGDFWEVDLLAGQQITTIDIIISNHSGASGFFVGAADDNVGGFGPFTAQAYEDLSGDGVYSLAATLGTSYPFSDGRYYFGTATNVGTNTGYSYEWQVMVESVNVPEPAILTLLMLGLAGIQLGRNRKSG